MVPSTAFQNRRDGRKLTCVYTYTLPRRSEFLRRWAAVSDRTFVDSRP
jgi:hypothetical protein